MQRKKKAFTLTELLVVVVIIGVLSAVVLPKFTKVIETRKTTEAEEMMTAVRTEQEARCTLSKNYQGDLRKLGSYRAGKNFSYANNSEGVGIVATAKNNKYNLEIPSYADGRVCCSDIEAGACANLNKSYPSCSDLINNTSDYVAGNTDCEVPGVGENPELDEPVAKCTEGEVTGSQACNGCGTQTTQLCKGGEWVEQLGPCSKTEEECKEYCEYGKPGWDKWSDTAQKCEQPQDPDAVEGTWNTKTCKCDCPEDTELSPDGEGCISACPKNTTNLFKQQACEDPQVVPGYAPVPGVWNWDGPHACDCDCPPGTKLDEHGQCVGGCQKTDDNLWDAQDCETGGRCGKAKGTWNWDGPHACGCDCPSGYRFVQGEGCVPICEQIYGSWINGFKQSCEQGDDHEGVYWDYIGTWSDCDCRCICPNGSVLYPNGVCYDPYYQGKPDDHDYDCPMPQEDCDGWDQWQWDNYDDYVDTFDWDWDYDWDWDGGDWDGW